VGLLFGRLRQLHVYLLDPAYLACYLERPSSFGEHIQHLSLIQYNEAQPLNLPANREPTKILSKLERLTLVGINIVDAMIEALTNMLDTTNLTHISMLDGGRRLEYDEDFGVEAPRTCPKLEHLALSLVYPDDIEDYLGDLLNANKHMKSLHVQWYGVLPSPQSLMDKIRAIGPRLELLSLHQGRQIELSSAVLSSVSFQAICESCPNLRQIGIRSDESSYFDNDPHGEIEYFIVSTDHAIEVTYVRLTLRRVPSNFSKIYIWSFRLEENWTVGRLTDDNERDPNIMAMQV
jgi:hypothetical protein